MLVLLQIICMGNLRPHMLLWSKAYMLMAQCKPFVNDMDCQSSTMAAPVIQGGYTSLILGVQQDATLPSSARKLHFHE
jgi:hypothetical protein